MEISSRTSAPRIRPLEPDEWSEPAKEVLNRGRPTEFGADDQPVFNLFKTLANYPAAMKRLAPWGNHVLFKSSLPPRDREILILRAGWLAKSTYEWSHHRQIALDLAGLTLADIEAIKIGPDAPGLTDDDRTLIRVADELAKDQLVSDATWESLAKRYSTEQLMDAVFAVGHYTMMSMALNSFGIELEESHQ